jgi:hypothetical protein
LSDPAAELNDRLVGVGGGHLQLHLAVGGAHIVRAESDLKKVLANLWNRMRITKEPHAGRGQGT